MRELEAKEPKRVPYKQKPLFTIDKNARKMPKDFTVSEDTFNSALDMGYSVQDLNDEIVKFVAYYTDGKGRSKRYRNWQHHFIYGWLDISYRNGYLKRNDKFYKLSGDEGRKESIKALTDPNLFSEFEEE